MVEIPSPSGEEDELAEYMVTTAGGLGLRAYRDDAGNAVAEGGGTEGPTVLLLGHLDTVPGELAVYERDGLLHGRGTVDAKGPLAAMLCAAARMSDRIGYRVLVVGAVQEEGDSAGARSLAAGRRPDAVLIGEPSGLDKVVLGYKGIVRLRLEIAREAAHPASPAEKAVEVAAQYWSDLRAHLGQFARRSPFATPIPTLTELAGDAERATMRVSCRVPVDFDSAGFLAWAVAMAGRDRLTVLENLPAVRSPRTDPVVSALSTAVRTVVGTPRPTVKLGTSDMNVVGPAWEVPIAAYGPGDATLDHTAQEHLRIADYLRAIEVLSVALDALPEELQRRRNRLTGLAR